MGDVTRHALEYTMIKRGINVEIYGKFIENEHRLDTNSEFLTLRFLPNATPLQNRWRTNGLSAEFLADYSAIFFPGEDAEALNRRTEIKSGVNFIANELLENAMKFNYSLRKGNGSINLTMELKENRIVFYVSNYLTQTNSKTFKHFINRLLTEDPNALYMEQLLQNEEYDNNSNTISALGYLTSINDWNALLGWKFEDFEGESDTQEVTVMVQLLIH